MNKDRESAGISAGVAAVGFVISFVSGAGITWGYEARHGALTAQATADVGASGWSDAASPVPIDSKDPMWGHRSALVTIVEFSDYQCPFCARVEPALEQVKSAYGPDKVRIVWKNEPLPFHANARPAAEAAAGVFALAGADAFWKFHDTAFKNQSALGPDSYLRWAGDAGVKDLARFKAGLDAHAWADKVDRDNTEALAVGQGGTPAFYINGVSLMGMQPFDGFKAVIDQELQKAQAKVARGTPKDELYVAVSQENKKNAPPPIPARAEKPAEDPSAVFKVPAGSSPATWGEKPLVTIVEFSDFQCPFCKRVGDTLEKLHAQHGDKLRLVFKSAPLPFHARAEPAAELALEARAEKGDMGFWKANAALFASAPKLEDDDLDRIAKELGLRPDKVHEAIATQKWKKVIDEDAALAASVRAEGLPHFFINGRRIVGAVPLENFEKVVDEELAKASGGATARR